MYKKIRFKVISIIIMILLILNFIPFSIYAELSNIQNDENTISENVTDETNTSVNETNSTNAVEANEITEDTVDATEENNNNSDISSADTEETSNSSTEIKGEITERREENVKYFLMSDYTVKAEVYQEPVHYKKDGKWEDIDNSLAETSDEEDGQKIEENVSNNFKVKFAKKAKDNKLVTIKSDKFKMKWSLAGANKVSLKKVENNSIESDDPTVLENVTSGVQYENIMKDMDIEYVVKSHDVKENIILKTINAANNKLIFNLDIGDLRAELNEDKTISIYNENNEEVSRIDSPYMYDSKLEFSNKIEITLNKEKKNYTVEIKPDQEWLNSQERVFPVTIDPTVETSLDYQKIQDKFIYEGDNGTTVDNAHILRVGVGEKKYRSLLKFELPTINSGDQIIDAKLHLSEYPDTSEWTPSSIRRQIDVHKMTSNWGSDASWNNSNLNYDGMVTDYNFYQFDVNNQGKEDLWDVTSIVKDWYVTGNNYGLMLKEHNEKVLTGQNEAYYLSANINVIYKGFRPCVTITFRNQNGLEDYWSYHSQDVGRAGTSYVNDYNGNLVLTNGDVQTPGNRMPLSIYHVYNSNNAWKDIGMGKGWRLNLSQTIIRTTYSGIEYAKYTDEDGTDHYFQKQGTTNEYKDEDGLGLKLTLNSDQTFTMVDKGSNKLIFEKKLINGTSEQWHLKQIIDVNNNTTTLSFLSNNNLFYINKVTDSAGSAVTINWNASGRIGSIVDQNGDTINYVYDTAFNLTTIKYIDGKQVEYQYDGNSYMTRAKDTDTSCIYYTYKPGNPYRVNSVQECGIKYFITQGVEVRDPGNNLNFDYGNNATIITDSKGYGNTYTFNNQGNLVSIGDFRKNN